MVKGIVILILLFVLCVILAYSLAKDEEKHEDDLLGQIKDYMTKGKELFEEQSKNETLNGKVKELEQTVSNFRDLYEKAKSEIKAREKEIGELNNKIEFLEGELDAFKSRDINRSEK